MYQLSSFAPIALLLSRRRQGPLIDDCSQSPPREPWGGNVSTSTSAVGQQRSGAKFTPEQAAIERHWHVGSGNPFRWPKTEVFPGRPGLFIRTNRDGAATKCEAVVGQWGLIPWFAKSAKLPYSTSNARSEELTAKATFKHPWARGQRCIIPAESFDEPNWESGKNVWWRFRRADAAPWGLAGLWNTWVDKTTGEIVESYTMLTINADAHPLMRRMHKPDPKAGPDQQDKRSAIPIELGDVDEWLNAPVEHAAPLLRVPSLEVFEAGPA